MVEQTYSFQMINTHFYCKLLLHIYILNVDIFNRNSYDECLGYKYLCTKDSKCLIMVSYKK